jgi:hypothetical protein
MTLEKTRQEVIQYDENGNAILVFDKDVHIITNGDFIVTAHGEVSMLSKTAISLDCALLLLNCRLSKQLREMKQELRTQFIDMLGGMPNLSPEQKVYLKATKAKAVDLLSLEDEEISHFEQLEKE